MNFDPYDQNVIVIGATGSGKTHFVKNYLIPKFYINLPAFWIYDFNYQYSAFGKVVSDVKSLKYGKYVFQPVEGSDEEFTAFVEVSNQYSNLPLILEELHEFARKLTMPKPLLSRVRTGRNFGNTYVAIFQRPSEVHESVLSNSTFRFIFSLDRPLDIDHLKRWVGDEVEAIKTAQKYSFYMHVKGLGGKLCNPI